ncbi:MAG: hypothetical protein A2511_04725 [Deltaproteobacteria bacterium RIFOXYD12_FULL_50_9]|nr:MAG: hypothetical protein A2511_04725 [Deltaproteobacteria bacterium RIFOXYD12_FULL_50_9]
MKIIRAFFSFITRPRVVIGLIVLLLLAAALGSLIPQVGAAGPAKLEAWRLGSPLLFAGATFLQLTHIYTSYWFLGLVVIIALALAQTVLQQIRKNRLVSEPVLALDGVPVRWQNRAARPEQIIAVLQKKGYRLQAKPGNKLLYRRFAVGRWGSAIFHLGLLIIVLAGLLALLFQQRGYVQVIEGDLFSGQSADFFSRDLGLLQKGFDTGFPVFLNKLSPEYWENGKLKNLAASLIFPENGSAEPEHAALGINRPVSRHGVRILQGLDFGYTVSLMHTAPDGKEYPLHFMLTNPQDPAKPFTGNGNLPLPGYRVALQFYPDLSMHSPVLGKPILWLTMERQGKGTVFNGLVPPGGSIPCGEGALSFYRVSWWSGLIFMRTPDMTLAYSGFILACLGAVLLYLFQHRTISVIFIDQGVVVTGRCSRYRPLFAEELAGITKELAEL